MDTPRSEIMRHVDFSKLPKNLIVYLGCDLLDDISWYCFWRNGKTFTVTKGKDIPDDYTPETGYLELKMNVEESEAKLWQLVMTRGLNFDHPDRMGWWAETKRGDRVWTRPLDRAEVYPRLPEYLIPIWNAKAQEEEIQVTKIISPQDRIGIWTGRNGVKRDVNLVIGWNKFWLQVVKWETDAHRLIIGRGLNMTYDMLAHVVDANGDAVGLMTSPHLGRMVEFEDIEIVVNAFRRLNQEGLYLSPQKCNIMIHDGQVRLRSISSLKRTPSVIEEAAKAMEFQWRALSNIFTELKQHKNIFPALGQLRQIVTILPTLPSPTLRVKTSLGQLSSFFNTITAENWELYLKRHQRVERKRERESGRAPGYPLIYPSDELAAKDASTGSNGYHRSQGALVHRYTYKPY
ncbi:hypothetical protein P691DRAFT_773231 [Macrolepiota fuliginosa MF-IS2]|uniref:Uncharacterized protein n=1 Tax=Macrolepiota fuliginosa MF-IS2 TaxID=1400762 RepID=A0A9P6C6Z3_9AGAR|nr:hypothetical protein P691DRAFT_773231 [Macrolepiota fuliginosa MF-IS2]